MHVEPWTIAVATIALALTVGALAAQDHETPMGILIRDDLGFVLAGAIVPLLLFAIIAPALPEPWKGAAMGSVAVAAFGLAAAYLRRKAADMSR